MTAQGSRQRLTFWLAGAAATVMLMSGCGGSSEDTDAQPTSQPTVTVTVTVTETEQAAPPSPSPETESTETSSPSPSPSLPSEPVETTVTYVKTKYATGAARSEDFIELEVEYTNVWNKRIKAIRGRMFLTDPFDDDVFSGNWSATGLKLKPGETYVQDGYGYTVDGSTGAAGCSGGTVEIYGLEGLCRADAEEFVDYSWSFEPETVKFKDGTSWP